MRLSVVLATHNEENNIRACLESVLHWCDEIVVVDGASTDKTVEIAKSFGARVIQSDNPPNFHINKQKAITQAKGNWMLQLDADERVTKELRKEIDQVIAQNTSDGFWIPRKNYFLGRFLMKGGVYPDYSLRLYKKGKGKLPQKDVHEQAVVDGKTEYMNSPLIHMADPDIFRYFLRFGRYTDFIADQLAKQRKTIIIGIDYIFIKPIYWFLLVYFRHKGFMDSWQGFLFALFSALRFPVAYIKYINKKYARSSD